MKRSVAKVHGWCSRRPSWQLWGVWLMGLLAVCVPTPNSVVYTAVSVTIFGAGVYALIVVNARE